MEISILLVSTTLPISDTIEIMLRPRHIVKGGCDQVVLRLLILPMPELAVRSLAATLDKILAHRILQLLIVILQPAQDMSRQLSRRSEPLLLALRAMEELAPGPVAHPVLEVMAERVLLYGIVLGPLVQILATFPSVADVPQKVPAHARGRRICARSRGTCLIHSLPAYRAFRLFPQLLHR